MPIPKPHIGDDGELYSHTGSHIKTSADFVLHEVLSSGANGVVLKVQNNHTGRFEALKVYLHPVDYAGADGDAATQARPDLRDKFAQARAEATAIAAVNDPHVVTALSAQEVAGRLCISFDLVDGITLSQWASDTPLPGAVPIGDGAQGEVDAEDNCRYETALRSRILKEICTALAAIYSVGYRHGDLHAGNIHD